MKIYDCFMFFDEEMLLDLRLNIMDKYVDKFVITESTYMHNGKPKKLFFDIGKFSKFKDKIVYIVINEPPPDIIEIKESDDPNKQQSIMIDNAKKREVYQINRTSEVISKADLDDIIIISDLDEIPNLENLDFKKINQKLIFFEQKMFYYKLNLLYDSFSWFGSKACKKKFFKNPGWLRSIKNKKYPFWRLDILFSKKKYSNIYYVKNGGWHFTNIRKPEDLEKKLLGFLHHVDYENSGLKLEDLKNLMNDKRIMYDHSLDKRENKWGQGKKLKSIDINLLPNQIKNNIDKYKIWLDV